MSNRAQAQQSLRSKEPPVASSRNGAHTRLACWRCGHESPYVLDEVCPDCGNEWLNLTYPGVSRNDLVCDDALGRSTIWRYRRFLPVQDERNIVSMGEGITPLLAAPRLGARIGLRNLFIKDERPSPTGSFKDRGASVCISKWMESGVDEMVLSSTGNVAAAFAAYAARAGIRLWTFVPERVNPTKLMEVLFYGHNVVKVAGTYDQAAAAARRFAAEKGLRVDGGVRNALRRESMKTVAFEIAEDLGWGVPDWYVQAVSGGIGPLGVWKGFGELYDLGLINKMPRIACVQASGCAPMARAFAMDSPEVIAVQAATEIDTLATTRPAAYPLIYEVVKASGGHICAVDEDETFAAQELLAQSEGVFAEAAAAVAFAGMIRMVGDGRIRPGETVVCMCSGKGLRDVEFVRRRLRQSVLATVPGEGADFSSIEAARRGNR